MYVFSRSVVSSSLRPHGLQSIRLLRPRDFPGKSTGVGCHFLLHGIFPTQGWNLGLLYCRQTLYHLSHQRSPISINLAPNYFLNSSTVSRFYTLMYQTTDCSTNILLCFQPQPTFFLRIPFINFKQNWDIQFCIFLFKALLYTCD